MDKRTLVIYDEPDFMQVLGAYARHELGGETIYAQNLAEAAGALREAKIGTIDLIISRGHVSADQNTPPPLERSEPTAIQFLRAMYPDSVLPPCIFVAAGASQRYLEAINGLKNSRILPIMDVQANANSEVEWLIQNIGDHHSSFGMATFQVVRQADFTGAGFGKHVYDLLESGQWHLIHYIGHSDVDRDGEGHLVMGPNLGDVLSIEDFAHAASKVQFVFLNSCLSANPGFIRRLVQRDVPAAAGYAWPVSDLVARTFCEAFYKELFASKEERGFIEYAYMRAKASLREAFPNHRMWTAPLLYMQAMDSQPN